MVKTYRALLAVPTIILILAVGMLAYGYSQTGEWFSRSIDLRGGSVVEVWTDMPVEASAVEQALGFPANVHELRGFGSNSIIIEVGPETEPQEVLDKLEAIGIGTSKSSVQTVGPSLGESFWAQAQMGVVLAFIFMGIIVFFLFRDFVPSIAVMLCAVSDIVVTLAVMQLIGMELSLAGLAALLMLIGYSIDTDILLTTRLLKGLGALKDRLVEALKTGLTMSCTTLGALAALLIFGLSPVLSEIATILLIGLVVDICYTWLQNSVLLRWHCERRGVG